MVGQCFIIQKALGLQYGAIHFEEASYLTQHPRGFTEGLDDK